MSSTIKLPRFDQNFLDTGQGIASQRIFLRKTNEISHVQESKGGFSKQQSDIDTDTIEECPE